MARTYKALAVLLSYPTDEVRAAAADAAAAVRAEGLVREPIVRALEKLAAAISGPDSFDAQETYTWLFDRTKSLSLNLYEHVHGESRDRGQAMVDLLSLYRSRGLELSVSELPDHLPVFLEFLSILPDAEAASLLGEAAHVIAAIGERLKKRESPYRAAFGALVDLAGQRGDPEIVRLLLEEPDDDPADLEALDEVWAETPVSFGPEAVGCPKAQDLVRRMNDEPAASGRSAGAA